MKFLNWLFSLSLRHFNGARRYERGGNGIRVFTVIFLIFMASATLGLEYLTLYLFRTNLILGIFVLVFAAGFFISTLENCGVYSYFGFKSAISGTLAGFINRGAAKRGNNVTETDRYSERKSYKAFDLFIGFFGIVVAVGLVIGSVLVINNFA